MNREGLQTIISLSYDHPIVVFKHSNSCSISSAAYRELEKLKSEVNMIVVQTARDVSQELARMTGVRHASPQVIILRNGNAVWEASHYDVSAGAVSQALQANQ
jgi:bacillithiol system protein YtxJ